MRYVIKVDPIACDGRGVCAELFPERITLDEWGFPIIDATPIEAHLMAHAKRSVNACPVLALWLEPAPAAASSHRSRPTAANRR
jgi:ferredoxin